MKTKYIILAAILAASSALQTAVAENKLPAPKPEFKTQEELVKWSEEKTKEAAAADSASAIRDSQFFFTGKPYLEESGTYAFLFRQYDPELSRWTSTDPSGFPDGANNRIYTRNIVTSAVDPDGLETVSLSYTPNQDVTSGLLTATFESARIIPGNIQAEAIVGWTISGAVIGWVVQSMAFVMEVFNDRDGSVYNVAQPPDFWEAWRVVNGKVSGGDRWLTLNYPLSTNGSITVSGIAAFYTDSAVSANSPSTWAPGAFSNGLPATTTEPDWWAGTGISRTLTMSWE